MIYNFPYFIIDVPIRPFNDLPPTLYSIMNAIVNYDNPNPVKLRDLAKNSREEIFDFDYPLTSNIKKEDFEVMILNHFMKRRIGFETFLDFKVHLMVKLNEIMPNYNMLFDSIQGWNLFNDGEQIIHEVTETTESTGRVRGETHNTNEDKYLEYPQGRLIDLEVNNYITNGNMSSQGGSTDSSTTANNTHKVNDTTKRTPHDKIDLYTRFLQNKKNIYTLIFKDLDSLFYGLMN